MENQDESQNPHKFKLNGTEEPTHDMNEHPLRSKNKKTTHVLKNPQLDTVCTLEHDEISPYVTSYPLANRLYALKNTRKCRPGMIGDRVMSAKLIKMKELENEISVLRQQLNETLGENRLLKSLQHRQDNALKKFEGSKGQLPQLIQSHLEEVRAIKAKCKKINMQNRDLERRLLSRESELRGIQEQYRHLLQLAKDKNLGERERLREEVESLKHMLQQMELQFQEIARKKAIEQRALQQRLNQETNHSKDLRKSLLNAEQNIQELKGILTENGISFEAEKNTSKSPKEAKKSQSAVAQRLPMIHQHHQYEAPESMKDTNTKKIISQRSKPCPPLIIKSKMLDLSLKDSLSRNVRKEDQSLQISSDEREIESAYQKVTFKSEGFHSHKTHYTSEDFYLSLGTSHENTKVNDADTETSSIVTRQHSSIHPSSEVPENSRDGNPCAHNGNKDQSTKDNFQNWSSGDSDISSTDRQEPALAKEEKMKSDRTSTSWDCDVVRENNRSSNLEQSQAHGEENEDISSSRKEKLLQALKDIDREEWSDIDTSDEVQTEYETLKNKSSRKVKAVKKSSTSLRKGKTSTERCKSGSEVDSTSNAVPSIRNSAKLDLMHDLFGTIPKSEYRMQKKRSSDPSTNFLREVNS